MALDRTTILKSPGKLVHDSATYFSEGDIVAEIMEEFAPVETDVFGPAAQLVDDRMIRVQLTPKEWSNLAKMLPYATKNIGDTIFGGTDKALVITPRNGAPLTVANAMPTRLPSIFLGGVRPILGPMEFTGLVANNSDPATVANYLGFGTPASAVALTGFDSANIPNGLYSAVWNGTTIRSETGFQIDFELNLQPDKPDGEPTLNYRIVSLEATVRFTPVGMTEANYLTLLTLAKGIGGRKTLSDIVITGGAVGMPVVTIDNCFISSARAGYGRTAARTGEVVLRTVRSESSGNLAALWTFGVVE